MWDSSDIVHKSANWPEGIQLQITPRFYFLEDGEIVDEVKSWPLDDSMAEELEDALRRFTQRDQ